jgi:AraC-like DNA-binding protein
MRRPDRHNEIELNCLHAGSVTYLFGGQRVRLKAGSLGVFWAAIPHQIVAYDPHTEYHVVTVPLGWFLNCQLPEAFVQGLMQGRFLSSTDRQHVGQAGALFPAWERDLAGGGGALRRAVLLEIEACLLRLALGLGEGHPPGPRASAAPGTMGKVEQMAGLIALRYTEPLMAKDIADAVGLHPNYAMNLFHKVFGDTLVSYITRHRISHAQRLLVTTDMKIVDLAIASGFGSLSRFNDAFRHACGCSPRDYRANLPAPPDGA